MNIHKFHYTNPALSHTYHAEIKGHAQQTFTGDAPVDFERINKPTISGE